MSAKDNGGPAFPNPINPEDLGRGMTLRDYFAANALAALIVSSDDLEDREAAAGKAYFYADAMLKARTE